MLDVIPPCPSVICAWDDEPQADVGDVWCQEAGGLGLRAIADTFGLTSAAGAGAGIRRFRRRVQAEATLTRWVDQFRRDLID